MTVKEIRKLIKSLASSQGFYTRLNNQLQYIDDDDEFFNQFKDCKDSLDIILTLEQ